MDEDLAAEIAEADHQDWLDEQIEIELLGGI